MNVARAEDFECPDEAVLYIQEIQERATNLIALGIWQGLDRAQLHAWLRNFHDLRAQYFAARILDRLNFRSERQTIAMIKHLLGRTLPDLARTRHKFFGPPYNWLTWLADGRAPVRFVEVKPPNARPGKSSQVIIRLMKRHCRVDSDYFIAASEIENAKRQGVVTFVFLDDFLGTGEQILETLENARLDDLLDSGACAYTPLAGHIEGVNNVRVRWKELNVRAVELLTAHHKLFHGESKCFFDSKNTPEVAKAYYYKLIGDSGLKVISENRRGFGHLELAYAFAHACPDNCLPILWASQNGWKPLLNR